MLIAPPRTAHEMRTLALGFSQDLPPGVTLAAPIVTAEPGPLPSIVQDRNPAATLSGAPFVNTQALAISTPLGPVVQQPGQAILQQVKGGIAGANYLYRFSAVRSDGDTCECDLVQSVVLFVPA